MKVSSLLQKVNDALHRHHHHSGAVKWSRRGETITDTAYEVTEREVKFHERLQAQSAVQRYSN